MSVWQTRIRDFSAFIQASDYDARGAAETTWQNPGFRQTENDPVVCVNWSEAQAFCDWLTKKERSEKKIEPAQGYRLPTEEEWRRMVGTTLYPWAMTGRLRAQREITPEENEIRNRRFRMIDLDIPRRLARLPQISSAFTTFRGNVWEWCADWYSPEQKSRVLRGGSCTTMDAVKIRSAFRLEGKADERDNNNGFRVVLSFLD